MTLKGWHPSKLGEHVRLLSGGTPSKSNPLYWGGHIPWVTCKDMKVSYLNDSQDHVTETGAAHGTRLVTEGTVLIVVRGMILGQHFPVALTKRRVAFNQDLKALQCDRDVDKRFMFYLLQGKSYEILGLADEAAHGTKRLQTDRLLNLPLCLPPLTIQLKIAAILAAYDELIENNTRRIAILEEMAQALYREWFVNFHFPGHEAAAMVESPLGPTPEGWEVTKLGAVLELSYGKALRSDQREPGAVPVYGSSGVVGYHSNSIVKGPGIIVGRKGNVGSVFWSDHDFFPIDTVFYVRTAVPLQYIYYNLKHQNFINNDAAVPGLNRNQAYSNPFMLPAPKILDLFQEAVSPIFSQVSNLTTKQDNLRRTRDLLLPKLISGEVDVEDMEIDAAGLDE